MKINFLFFIFIYLFIYLLLLHTQMTQPINFEKYFFILNFI